ncbi:MAG: diguanylate cyclase [Methylococcales bacterium]|nr:diguanylate cyclase [Methylococcales bacterium]
MNSPQAETSKGLILVVDDSQVTRYRITNFFREINYETVEAADGLEAIAEFDKRKPDIVLMDIHMPNMDGLSACKNIKQKAKAKYVPVIMITTLDQEGLVDQAFEYGAIDYITKPIHWPVLRNRVEYLLRAKRAEAELFEEKEAAHATLRSIGDAVITTDSLCKIKALNPAAERLTGWQQEDAREQDLQSIYNVIDEETREPVKRQKEACKSEDPLVLNNNILIKRDGQEVAVQETDTPLHDRDGKIIGAVLIFRDVTKQREYEKAISYQASHDELTGLINRREFENRCQRALDISINGEKEEHALMFMDLDKFKVINDTCGHASGDTVLKEISQLMLLNTRSRDSLARIGGDEFALLLENCKLFDAMKVAEKIRRSIANYKYNWNEEVFNVGVSVGITTITDRSDSLHQILHCADTACYKAKNAGRNCVKVYDEIEDAAAVVNI